MSNHVRQQIRAAAVAALTGLSTTGARVKDSPVHPLQDSDLPGLRIFVPNGTDHISSIGSSRTRERICNLVVEACVKMATGYADAVDAIAAEVETALDANSTLGGLCTYVEPRSFEEDQDGSGDKPVSVGRLTFEVLYRTRKGAPTVAA